MSLSKTEEELMNHLWKLEKAFMKELLEVYPEPKPATTTVATLLNFPWAGDGNVIPELIKN